MNLSYLASLAVSALALVAGIVVHESAHALMAYALGDRTARSRGRISLNPLKHVDPFGTVLLPLIMILAGGPVFAFAKPVPVYVNNLRHPRRDEVLVALAGPLSNIALSLVATMALRVVFQDPALIYSDMGAGLDILISLLAALLSVNLSLAFFNLIPLPPLDGSSILRPFLRGRALRTYYEVQRYSMPILIVVLYVLPSFLHFDLLGWYFGVTVDPIYAALIRFALGV